MKKSARFISLLLCVMFVFSTCFVANAATAYEMGNWGKTAQKYFKVQDNNVWYVSESADSVAIYDAAIAAGKAYAETGEAQMVYVPNGTHRISSYIEVPTGVILAGEKNCVYSVVSNLENVIWLYGSVYGGKFNGNNRSGQMIRFRPANYTWPSGYVLYTTIQDCSLQSVVALGDVTGDVRVCNNTMKNALDGVCSIYGAMINLIDGNNISYMEQSGVDVTHANAGTISNNKIYNVTGHGISTDTDQTGHGHAYVRIAEVRGNTINKAGHHGIYLEANCVITGNCYNNVITNSALNGVCIGDNASIGNVRRDKYFYYNTVKGSTLSNISVGGKNAVLVMGSKNEIREGKAAGIAIGSTAAVYVYGRENYIFNNAMNGVQMDPNSSFLVKGSGRTYITYNRWGINMNKGATVRLQNTTIRSNNYGAAYYVAGSSLRYSDSNCSISGRVYKKV